MDSDDRDDFRTELGRMLAHALEETDQVHAAELDRRDQQHIADTDRRDQLHISETERRDVLHHGEISRRQDVFEHEIDTIRNALETRDLIGQAKGIIIASTGCTADEAFLVLVKQSQTQNRKINEIAADLVSKAQKSR